jgi:hypothetical protein
MRYPGEPSPDQEADDMTYPWCSSPARGQRPGWRAARFIALAAAIGFGGWQAGQIDWSGADRALDRALWTHALKDRPAATDLHTITPVWREREGASGDKIVERIDRPRRGASNVEVLGEESGQAIPAPALAEQAANSERASALPVEPARFNGLSAGDRLTVRTTGGDVYAFEVVTARGDRTRPGDMTIHVITPDDENASALYAIRPVDADADSAIEPQQEL